MGHVEQDRSRKRRKIEEEEDLSAAAKQQQEEEEDVYWLETVNNDGMGFENKFRTLSDHANRPISISPDGHIFLETCSPFYQQAPDILITIAEPVCRPDFVHEYNLTPHLLYAAVSAGLTTQTILSVLNILSKTKLLPNQVIDFIHASTSNYGKVKLVLKENRYSVESRFPEILKLLLKDEVISRLTISSEGMQENDGFTISKALDEMEARHEDLLTEAHLAAAVKAKETYSFKVEAHLAAAVKGKESYSFEVDPAQVENVKQRCLPNALNYPMLEEYDFRNDTVNPDLDMVLKPQAQLRPYQEKSLTKMFRNGRARSGIIVLPCGAGKSLVGVYAASLEQWVEQFKLWSTIQENQICQFTSDSKEGFCGNAGVVVTTYNMVAFDGNRSQESEKIIEKIRNREWGLLLMDEVHVVPAQMFRKVIGITKSHCKLGLTVTNKISDKAAIGKPSGRNAICKINQFPGSTVESPNMKMAGKEASFRVSVKTTADEMRIKRDSTTATTSG
ncbi:DNA helicase [Heracleum sosnowskyi]|uniref:DNA helicase n=1 Tax=Heracleum sosnowskyi TaxID=360622 RepID=A0AAD8H9C6_9APIA|nr:DNA helicase [Heracleum sosnowskyi]